MFLRSRTTIAILFAAFLIIGVALLFAPGEIWLAIGTSLVTGAVISLATLLIDQVRNGEQVRMKELMDTGLLAAHKRRNLEEYASLVANAKSIDVAGYTLKSFFEQNESILKERADKKTPIVARLLLVDPECEASKIMQAAERLPVEHYAGSQKALLHGLRDVDGVTVKMINQHLSMMIYRIDSVIYTGPYPHSAKSSTALTLKLGTGWFYDRQMEEFESLWAKARLATFPSRHD
jgi:hypothetical protein